MKFLALVALIGLATAQGGGGGGGPDGPPEGEEGEGDMKMPKGEACESSLTCEEGTCCSMNMDMAMVCMKVEDVAEGECMMGAEEGSQTLAASAIALLAVATMMN